MPHRVSPRLTVYSVGAVGLIMSAVGAGAADTVAVPPPAVAWMAASVAVSWCSGAAEPVSTGATVGSSTGWEWPNMAQPLSEIAAAASVTVRPGLNARLKVILPSSTIGGGAAARLL